MLAILSSNLMHFFDRLILSHYALAAMNAAAASGMVCIVFQAGIVGITSIAEVFVGKRNGAGDFHTAAQPAWQMIWFSFLTFPLLYLVATYLGAPLLSDYHYTDFGLPYFQWTLYFTPCFAAQTALSAFFIGIGKTRLVTLAIVTGNIINILLDLLLVFGLEPYIPSMATKEQL